jgi:hypothetical protein
MYKFLDVTVPHKANVHTIVNKLVQKGFLFGSGESNCSVLPYENEIKSMLGFNMLLNNSSYAL